MLISLLKVCKELGGQVRGYFGSSLETWRTGSLFMSEMSLFDPKENTLKMLCGYHYQKGVRN